MTPFRREAILMIWCAIFLPTPCSAARETVSGGLERVTHSLVTIRRPDGIVLDTRLDDKGKLRLDMLAARYKIGDLAEVSYKEILPVFDEETHVIQRAELVKIKFLRGPSSEELAVAIHSPAWKEPGNLLEPPAVAMDRKTRGARVDAAGAPELEALEWAREVNRKRVSNMPNFTADETATRYTATSASARWELLDVIKSEIAFKGRAEMLSLCSIRSAR